MNDVRIIALISAGHMVSHFLALTLPPLFPLLKSEFDVSMMIFTVVHVRRRVVPRPVPAPGG